MVASSDESTEKSPRRGMRRAAVVAACAGPLLTLMSALVAAKPEAIDVTDQGAPTFTVYTARDGLSDEIWNSVDVDRRGIAWAGSASTLARFDGYRWTLWPVAGAHSLVRDIEPDPAGTLWAIFEREGLARLDGDHWQLQAPAPDFLRTFSADVGGSTGRELWVTHDRGAWQWRDGAFAPALIDKLPPGNIARLVRTETLLGGPRLWLTTTRGVWWRSLNAGATTTWQHLDDPRFVDFATTEALRTHNHGAEELWLLSYGSGIARIDAQGMRVWRAANGELPTEAMYNARATHGPDGERLLWISSRAGLLRVRGDEVRAYDRRHGLPADAVRSVEVQRNVDGVDLLWLATEGGIVRAALGHSQWQTVSLLGARENGVFGLLLEPDDRGGERLWVGTAKEGLHLLERGQWTQFSSANGALPLQNVRQIWRLTGTDGGPWRLLSVLGGLYEISDTLSFSRLATPWDGIGDDAANAALARQANGQWEHWFANLSSGIWQLRDGRWTQHRPPGTALPWVVTGLIEQIDSDGRSWLWAASNDGLALFDGAQWTLLPTTVGVPAGGFRSVTLMGQAGREILWAGSSRHGVVRIDVRDPRRPRLLTNDGIPAPPDPTVYSVLPDSQGRIYVCTNNGVQQLTPTADGAFSERVFRRAEGLVHDECNTNSQFVDTHDRYWVGTLGGLSVHDPSIQAPTATTRNRPILLTDVRVDGARREVAVGATLTAAAGTREISIDYALLSGQRERESRYRSQLSGFDPQPGPWTDVHRRSFTTLPAGRYLLRVDARDYAGNSGSADLLTIEILPFWWQRTWVQLTLSLTTLLAIALAMRVYNGNLRLRQRRLKEEVALRTAELDAANHRLTELSYQDPLTGVANRRRLAEALDAAVARARDRQLPIGLIVIDVDHFKDYNDRHGHLAGDSALRAVAQALQAATRPQDLVARYGGEEFACLMVDADRDTTLRIAERMRALVEALPPRSLGNADDSVTLSAGVLSVVPGPNQQSAELLHHADAALYQAKRAGRNRVQLAI